MTQIGGYLNAIEHAEFKSYASEFHISESGLANLLIARELRCKRLRKLRIADACSSLAGSRERVTAHQRDNSAKVAFEARASEEGLRPDQAASIIFRAELREQWLAQSITSSDLESY